MEQFSISFTLGRESEPHGANLAHNNREFSAANIAQERTQFNIVFANQDVENAYEQLFHDALESYNAKQTRPCRQIHDYYAHVKNGKREEAFYEAVVQFGDSKNAPCGSERGEIAKELLIEYMQEFGQRNPNLFVFNSVLHMDEASPHLHIDFVPFYTKGRKTGLSKGVSMRAALEEMGFAAYNRFDSPIIGWEKSERIAMEKILMRHGYARDERNAHYAHMTVPEYKRKKDAERAIELLRQMQQTHYERAALTRNLQMRVAQLSAETEALNREKHSPYRAFFYSNNEKQLYVQTELDRRNIPYRQTETGFEAQCCYVEEIRRIEKSYSAKPTSQREKMRADIDRVLMRSTSLREMYSFLMEEGYELKNGKYPALRAPDGVNFIRLRSLGADYTDLALINRIKGNQEIEHRLAKVMEDEPNKQGLHFRVLSTMRIYMIEVKQAKVTPRKKIIAKPVSWINDPELDRLLLLNRKVYEGATLQSLKTDFEKKDAAVAELREKCKAAKDDLQMGIDLREMIEIVFAGKESARFTRQQAEQKVKTIPSISSSNWRNAEIMVTSFTEAAEKAERELAQAEKELRAAAELWGTAKRVAAGTFVSELRHQSNLQKVADMIPNGFMAADENFPARRTLKR